MDNSLINESISEDKGRLKIRVTTGENLFPVNNAQIDIATTGEPNVILYRLETGNSGVTDTIELDAPPLSYSLSPSDNQPYSEYNIKVSANGYEERLISGIQILSGELGIQNVKLTQADTDNDTYNPTVIAGHTLWEYYPPKIAEEAIKPLNESGEIVLNRVVVPETIIVHDGVPTDSTATNFYVPYADYIKNVACCEIYSTWPDEAIKANILAIMSFTLNRVYTEWYRNKGYNFTITSSTAYDHKWTYGKTIYEDVSRLVDSLIGSYLSLPNVRQPILTQYCDGKRTSCPEWMSQWGSKALADDGLSAIDILRYYYNSNIYINTAPRIAGIPSSYPGYDLDIGSSGQPVITIQEQLNEISKSYPAIPKLNVDGIFGSKTKAAVSEFQKAFDMPASGIVDYPTWYRISSIYVAVSKIAE
ncbi:MAG: peptidoglycan-binding protein [Lachnospiraceae bacterium]|nr:peptidoglycan-binding protein [Lachnospiraceae bacterium]